MSLLCNPFTLMSLLISTNVNSFAPVTCATRLYRLVARVLILSVLTASPAMAIDAVLLKQESRVTGSQNVYIAARAVRIDNQKTGTTIVCRAPDWDVDIYNKRNRTTYHCAAQEFKAVFFNLLTKLYREAFASVKWKKAGTEVRSGEEITKFSVPLDIKHSRLDMLRGDITGAEYFVGTGFKLPSKVCNVMSTYYSMPLMGKVPIQCTFYGVGGETLNALSTKEIKKIVVVDPFFDLPKFTLAKSEREVFIDPKAQAAMEELFGEPPTDSK